jgi:DNA-binding SARP family transcriptional activator/tetratricopeptide (TPR) repeat protein
MDVRVFGPLQAIVDGRPVALGGVKPRALLAMLALNAGSTVSSERLIEGLWGENQPATATKLVQIYVSQLRKALAAGGDGAEIVTRGRGYELRLGSGDVDARRFERLIAQAAPREALALWRGPPLDDVAGEPFAAAEIRRLEELRLGALELAIERDLAAGRHREVVGELEMLVAEEPLRERLHAQRMLALYRCGRQADALQAYRHARALLVEQIGVEPGPQLRRLHEAILRQDASLEPPAAAAVEPPPELDAGTPPASGAAARRPGAPAGRAAAETARGAFVGREPELGELIGGLDDACAGHGRLFLLAGEPGIGKSRLAEELLAHARARGARVLVGRCWEAGGAPAYWPWVQSLRAYVRETDMATLRSQLGAGAADLAQIVPELRQRFPDLPAPPSLESEGARFGLFEAATSLLLLATRDRPVVLVLDDLHAADEPSLLLLRFVAREIATSRVLVVCAYRDVDPTLRAPLSSALAELVREPQSAHIVLAGLSQRDVAEYIKISTGVEPAIRLVRVIHTETEGNPLFVAEVVRLLEAEGRIAQPDAHLRIPPGVRAAINQRVGRLSEPCRNLLVAASVMGREFGLDALALLSELSRDDLLDVLDEAMAERVLGDVPGSPGRLRFGHALIRDTLYDALTTARRMQLHKAAGEALEAVYSADLDPHLAELAQQFFAAAPAGVAERAVDYARRAGDRAASQLGFEEAIRLYDMGLALVEGPVALCDLLLARGDAQARAGDTPSAKETFRQAAELAERRGLAEQLARAALGYGSRAMWDVSRDDDYLVPLLERAIAALGDDDSTLRVRLLARLAGGPLRDASFPPERKAALSEQALAAARRMGDPATLAYAIQGYILGHHSPEHTPRQLELASELVAVATEVGDKERMVEGQEGRLDSFVELGDMTAAKLELEAMTRLARDLRQPTQEWFAGVYRALITLLEGRLSEAEDLISAARGLGELAQAWSAEVTYRLQLYVLRREQGRLAEVEDLVRRSVDEYPTYPIWRCVLAQLTAQLGDHAEARAILEALAADRFATVPFDEEWLVSMGLLAETATALADAEHASVLYDKLLPYADRVAISYPEISTGSVARDLGLLAAVMERWDDAERHFENALETNGRIGARPWLAHTQEDYARMLLARGTPGDEERALKLRAAARSNYRNLGMNTFAKRASVVDQPPKDSPPPGRY